MESEFPLGVSTVVFGSAAAPGAGATVATFSSAPAAGIYEVTVDTHAYGPVAVGDNNNMQLTVGATNYVLIVDAGTGTQPWINTMNLYFDGNTTPLVKTVGAATAGTTYSARIVATRIQ